MLMPCFRLNPTDMLERLRGKRLVFVGDSLNRNMWESLVCILRHSVKDTRKVFEASGRREFKTEGSYSFLFIPCYCYNSETFKNVNDILYYGSSILEYMHINKID